MIKMIKAFGLTQSGEAELGFQSEADFGPSGLMKIFLNIEIFTVYYNVEN